MALEFDTYEDDKNSNFDEFNNVTDWSLQTFQRVYSPDLTKQDIWAYIYGVLHAPDLRQEFRTELQKNLPRIPLAPGGIDVFRAFQRGGAELFSLHVDYENCQEAELAVILEEGGDYRIKDMMRWEKEKTVLAVNNRCRIVDIPPEAHSYQISGRSPLEWAVASLRVKKDSKSGIVDDVNGWRAWVDEPYELIRHLLRLAFIGIRSAEIIQQLPPSLPSEVF